MENPINLSEWKKITPQKFNEQITIENVRVILSTYFVKNNNLNDFKFVNVKYKKDSDKIIISFDFSKERNIDNSLKLGVNKGQRTFSSGSIIKQIFEKKLDKPLYCTPKKWVHNNKDYYIIEVTNNRGEKNKNGKR